MLISVLTVMVKENSNAAPPIKTSRRFIIVITKLIAEILTARSLVHVKMASKVTALCVKIWMSVFLGKFL